METTSIIYHIKVRSSELHIWLIIVTIPVAMSFAYLMRVIHGSASHIFCMVSFNVPPSINSEDTEKPSSLKIVVTKFAM